MVSGFSISPKDLSRISSGDNNPTVIELKDRDNLGVGLFEKSKVYLLQLI